MKKERNIPTIEIESIEEMIEILKSLPQGVMASVVIDCCEKKETNNG